MIDCPSGSKLHLPSDDWRKSRPTQARARCRAMKAQASAHVSGSPAFRSPLDIAKNAFQVHGVDAAGDR
jgi:hypothetical protein